MTRDPQKNGDASHGPDGPASRAAFTPSPEQSAPARSIFGASVQRRLGFLIVAITLVGLAAGILITVVAYRNERASVTRQLAGTARAIASAVDLQVRELETLLRTLAASSHLAETNLAAFHRLCSGIETNDDVWVVMEDTNGQQLINTRVPFGTKLPRKITPPEEAAAFARGEAYASDLFVGTLSRLHVVFIGIPVPRPGGDYHLTIAMRPGAVSRALQIQELSPDATIAIADRKGTIIARNKGGDQVVGTPAMPDMVRAVTAKEEGIFHSVTKEGVPVFAAISRSAVSGWSVLVGVPKSECLASAHRLLALAAGLAVFLLVFALGVSIWIRRSVVRAVEGLVQATTLLARGEKPAELKTGLMETDFVSAALLKTSREISDRQHQLAEVKEALEQQVTARTGELADANHRLSIANRELESFAHIAVHDLREPLRTIHGFSSSLREDFEKELPADALLYTDRIQTAATRMNRLLESIFAYSRVSAPRREPIPVMLNAVLDEVLGDLELRLRETGGRVVAGELGTVFADHADIHQLLLNLIANALKFRRDGVAPIVEIESGRVGSDIHLVIKDNGIGFDPQYAEKIFSPFERLQTDKRYEGTGMGLAIVRRIAERQGGSAYATSVPGVGSRFVVILRACAMFNGRQPNASDRFSSPA